MYAVQAPIAGIQHHENRCKANVNEDSYGEGDLYVAESELIWRNESGNGIRLQYPDIAVHAISKDTQAFPEECLYVMYNRSILSTSTESADTDSNSESDTNISEIRFIPQDKNHLGKMFDAMSDCQCLHPDDEDSDYCGEEENDEESEEFEDGAAGEGFYTGEEGLSHMTPQGLATMQRLEAMLAQQQTPTSNGDGNHFFIQHK
uniref:Methylosome subunit pICln n=1 Tax=Phallusia mammillata TaxID=59560 RepID=A0A6F9DAC0_9ASCI|nr:methylosome subunit pICln-like [Phallusia mammillata]